MTKSQIQIPWTSFPVWSIDRLIICNVDRNNSRGTITFPIITRRGFSQPAVGLCSSVCVVNDSCCILDFFWILRFWRRVIFRIAPSDLTTSTIFWHRAYTPIGRWGFTIFCALILYQCFSLWTFPIVIDIVELDF